MQSVLLATCWRGRGCVRLAGQRPPLWRAGAPAQLAVAPGAQPAAALSAADLRQEHKLWQSGGVQVAISAHDGCTLYSILFLH